jgi:Uma2 family endonuclease
MQAPSYQFPGWGQPLLGGSTFTADDVERMPDDGFRYEVFRGVLIRLPVNGIEQGLICQFVGTLLGTYWRSRNEKYRVVQHAGFDFTVTGDPAQTTMLVPDVAVKADNVRYGQGISKVAPLIAVEVASPSDSKREMREKAVFYLNGGVAEVWAVWPKTRTVDVWTTPTIPVTYTDQQLLTSAHLPGWDALVSAFFDG